MVGALRHFPRPMDEALPPRDRKERKTPSRRDGVQRALEEQLRSFGVEQIQRAAALLRLRQVVSASASTILQHFYFRRSLAEFDVRSVAAAALLLACKLEESNRRLRDILVVFHRLRMRQDDGSRYAGMPTPVVDTNGREFSDWKQEVIDVERNILIELGFRVSLLLEHPHKFVIQFIKAMVRQPDWLVAEMAQKAWNYLNDSMRTVVACKYRPHEIATAAILLAARALKVKLPSQLAWWELFDCELRDVQRVAATIMSLYSKPPARYVEIPRRLARDRKAPADAPGSSVSCADNCGKDLSTRTGTAFSEWELDASARQSNLDPGRINDLLGEPRPLQAKSSSSAAAAASSVAGRGVLRVVPAKCNRSRSRSPRKRRVVQLMPLQRTLCGSKGR